MLFQVVHQAHDKKLGKLVHALFQVLLLGRMIRDRTLFSMPFSHTPSPASQFNKHRPGLKVKLNDDARVSVEDSRMMCIKS